MIRSAIAMAGIVAMHLLSPRIMDAAGRRLSMLLSIAGGVAVGYVFVGMLPKIGVYTAKIVAAEPQGPEILQFRLYLLSLAGFLVYFAADRFRARAARGGAGLVLHGTAFAGYNALSGYLLAQAQTTRIGFVPIVLVGAVFSLHLFAMDHQLRDWHRAVFDRGLRWLLAACVAAGWLAGALLPISEAALAAWSAVLAGGILANVFNEELPGARPGQVPAFLAGVVLVLAVAILFRTLSKTAG